MHTLCRVCSIQYICTVGANVEHVRIISEYLHSGVTSRAAAVVASLVAATALFIRSTGTLIFLAKFYTKQKEIMIHIGLYDLQHSCELYKHALYSIYMCTQIEEYKYTYILNTPHRHTVCSKL